LLLIGGKMHLKIDLQKQNATLVCPDDSPIGFLNFNSYSILQSSMAIPAERMKALERVYDAARGLCFGVDWNNGTAAKIHGYRQKLIDAVNSIEKLPLCSSCETKSEPEEPEKKIEILGNKLKKAFAKLGIKATKTYQAEDPEKWQDICQVWELDESEFEKLNSVEESQWKSSWGWWREGARSNFSYPKVDIIVNGEDIIGWYDEHKMELYIEDYACDYAHLCGEDAHEKLQEDFFDSLEFPDLLTYFCDHLGISTEGRVCALATQLAEINGITMGELFRKYQG
jgi:hypothetical protein